VGDFGEREKSNDMRMRKPFPAARDVVKFVEHPDRAPSEPPLVKEKPEELARANE
jgi:hypothetical protein